VELRKDQQTVARKPKAMKLNKLTANQAARAQPGRYGDGGGLALIVSTAADGSLNKKWVFRFTWNQAQ